MVWRFVQAFGASPGLTVGAGVIGDIYALEERGTAMGIFFSVRHLFNEDILYSVLIIRHVSSGQHWRPPLEVDICLVFLQLVLFSIPGFAAHYASWLIMQSILGITGCIIFTSMMLFFPETSHPGARGVDKLQLESTRGAPRSLVFINPLRTLWLLRSPNILALVRRPCFRCSRFIWCLSLVCIRAFCALDGIW